MSYKPLPDPWPETIVGMLLPLFGPCDDCCTAATDGDLCERDLARFSVIEEHVREALGLDGAA